MPKRRISTTALLTGLMAVVAVTAAAASSLVISLTQSWVLGVCAGLISSIVVAVLLSRNWAQRYARHMRALSTAVSGLADGDFSISVVASGGAEMEELIERFGEVGETLRHERLSLHHRELLLDTVIQTTPVAMLLIDARSKIIYTNTAARTLLASGRRLEGEDWSDIIARQTVEAQPTLRGGHDGLFSIEDDDDDKQVYMVRHKRFMLNARPHRLVMLESLTRELNRQEVATWKKVIRVLSHELNNSIAPIASLTHSSRKLAQMGDAQRLLQTLDSVSERANHLSRFMQRYATFARLPDPRPRTVEWRAFFNHLQLTWPFELIEPIPTRAGRFDSDQLEQVMINLLKNATEASTDNTPIQVACKDESRSFIITVSDRGPGMDTETLARALVPFYSTKPGGGGIGLALCREIIEAHDGVLSLENRAGGGLRVSIRLPAITG